MKVKILFLLLIMPGIVNAQESNSDKHVLRRQFMTLTVDWMNVYPLHFKKYPLEQLAEVPLDWDYQRGGYHSGDRSISITNTKFEHRNRGVGIMVYPFGLKEGTTLAVRANYETLPTISFVINSPEGQERYDLKKGQVYNLGIGAISGGRSGGWGLGAYSFIIVGKGWINEPRGNGRRYFVEAGGRVTTGPLGIEIFFGVANNKLFNPRPHSFFTVVPFGLRAMVTF